MGHTVNRCRCESFVLRAACFGLFAIAGCAAPPLPNAKPILEVGAVIGDGTMQGCVGDFEHTLHPVPDMVHDAFFDALKQRGIAAERGVGGYVLLTRIDSLRVFCNQQLKQEGHVRLRFVVVAKPANTLVYQGSGQADLTGASAAGMLIPAHSINPSRAIGVSDAQAARLQMPAANANPPADIGEELIRNAVANALEAPDFKDRIQSLLQTGLQTQ